MAMVEMSCSQGVMSVRSFADLFTVSMRAGVRASKERCRKIDEMHKCVSTLSFSVCQFLCVYVCVFLSVCVSLCLFVCVVGYLSSSLLDRRLICISCTGWNSSQTSRGLLIWFGLP